MNKANLSYEALLLKLKEQELEVNRLTEKVASLSSFNFFIEESNDLVCIVGTDAFFKEINPAFVKILGYSKEELLQESFLHLLHPDDLERSLHEIGSLAMGNPSTNFENRFKKKNGDFVLIQWIANAISVENFYAIGRDISEIRSTQEKLIKKEDLLNHAQQIAKMGSWEFNLLNKKMIWSEELYSIYGIESKTDQNLYQEFLNLFSEEDATFFQNKINQSIADKEKFEVQQNVILSDNSNKWLHAIVIPLLDTFGNVYALRGNTQDITQKKIIEDSIKEQEAAVVEYKLKLIEEEGNAKFKTYIENAPDGVFVLDEKGNYVDVNHAATVLTGYSKKELLTMSFGNLSSQELQGELYKEFQILLEKGTAKKEFKTIHKKGAIKWWSVEAVKLSKNRFLGFVKDITESKKALETIKNNDKYFRALVENNEGIITVLDENLKTLFRSTSSERITGYSKQEFAEISDSEYFHPDYIDYVNQKMKETFENPGVLNPVQFQVKHKEGHYIWIKGVLTNLLSENGVRLIIANLRDITESKIAQDKIEQSEKRFRALVENNDGIITVFDKDINTIFRSPSSARVTGYTDDEFEKILKNEYFHPDYLDYVNQMVQKAIDNPGKPIELLFQAKHKNGNYIWLQGILNNKIDDSSIGGIISNLRDITETKIANETLLSERNKFAKIADASPGLIYSMRQNKDGSLSYPYTSKAIEEIYGFTFKEIENNAEKIFQLIHPDDLDFVVQSIALTKSKLVPLKCEYRYFHPKKGLVWHDVNSLPVVEPEGTVICHGIVTDITQRIRADQKLIKANRLYLFISQINQMIVRTTDEKTLFEEACKIAVDLGKFRMVWIGTVDKKTKKLIPEMIAGENNGYLSIIKTISIEDIPEGRGPAGTAMREARYVICNDIENDPMMQPWRKEALSRGYLSSMAVPIKKSGKVIGVFSFYANEKNFFDAEEIALLEEATGDVSFALEVFEKEALRKKAEEAVIESEQRYHLLTDIAPVGIFRTDASGYTTFVNPHWCQISGLSFQEAIGNGWLKSVHEEDKNSLFSGWQTATNHKQNSSSEYRFVRQDGCVSWVMGQALPEKNIKNEIVGYVGTITDITERKNAEAIILREKNLSDSIINNLPGIFYLYDESGSFLKWNKNFEEVTGYDYEEIRQMNPVEFFDGEEKQKVKTRIKTVFERKSPGIEVEFFTKNKNKIPYYISSHVIDYEGKRCLVGMGIDLTERKKAEEKVKEANERFEMIAAATNDAVFEVDLVTGVSWNNQTFVDLLGFGSIEPNGENNSVIWRSRVHPDDRERVIINLEDSNEGIANLWSDEFRFQKADGSYGILYGRGVISRDEKGKAQRLNGALTEITELKNIKKQLINSEEKYRSLVEQASDAIFINNVSGELLEVNESACLLLGYSKEELCTKNLQDLYSKEELKSRPIMLEELLGGEKTLIERNMLHRDGTLISVEITAKMIVDGRIVAIVRDVTQRKKSEDDFRKMNKKLEAIIGALPDLLFEVNIEGKIFNYHSRRDDLLAFPPKAFLGKTFSEVLPPDVSNLCISAIREASEKGYSTGRQYSLELPSDLHWFELSIAPMQESQDDEMHYICLSRDITAAKKSDWALLKSEERYRGLLNNLDAGIVVHAPDTSVVVNNMKAAELLGLTDNQMRGITAFDATWNFLNEDNTVMSFERYPVNQIVATKKALKNFRFGVSRPITNDVVWLLINGYPDMDANGEIYEIVISFIDISDQKVMEMELVKAKELAEAANKAKTDFLANMSHEIRTPLNGIIGFTHLLMKSNLKKNQSAYMKTVNESAISLMDIVNDVLDFSKIESGKLELNIEEINLFKLTNQVINLFKYQADLKKIDLILDINKSIPQYILADSVRLKQILVNLLSNAIKFTNFGEIRLDITEIETNEKKWSIIMFSVKDTGVGIKTVNNEKIFNSFVQEDNSTNHKFGGTGLGLAISNQLLALMDSKLQLISKHGDGSDFYFVVKFKKTNHKKNKERLLSDAVQNAAIIPVTVLEDKKVLIVEDNKINMLLARTLVKKIISNCIIIEAKDGNEAVELYKKEQPDVILMDIQMPNKNGYQATKEIRQLKGAEHIPIIAITAGIMVGDKEKCLEAGMNGYLPKPIIQSDLEQMLFMWLQKK
ncbi:PAS domain S-box protein [Flavobacterium petrolei]|uniref:PAS domain S-box protein n=1 Tax=Flavobacterium petrolei TaxID=2259594 RepID=UPI003757791C